MERDGGQIGEGIAARKSCSVRKRQNKTPPQKVEKTVRGLCQKFVMTREGLGG